MKRPEGGRMWLGFAHDDLRVGRMAFDGGIFNMACFHAQQAAEKSLKGLLKANGKDVPRTHSLAELVRLCTEVVASASKMKESCRYLDRFYAPTRYPDAFPGTLAERMPTRGEAEKAVELSAEIYEEAWRIVKGE